MSAMALSDTNSKSKRYFCWRRCWLPQRIIKYASSPPPSRLNIIFDLEWYKGKFLKLNVVSFKILRSKDFFIFLSPCLPEKVYIPNMLLTCQNDFPDFHKILQLYF